MQFFSTVLLTLVSWFLFCPHCYLGSSCPIVSYKTELGDSKGGSYGIWPLTSSPPAWLCFLGCRLWRRPPGTGSWDRPLQDTCTECRCRRRRRALGRCRCGRWWKEPPSGDYSYGRRQNDQVGNKWMNNKTEMCLSLGLITGQVFCRQILIDTKRLFLK